MPSFKRRVREVILIRRLGYTQPRHKRTYVLKRLIKQVETHSNASLQRQPKQQSQQRKPQQNAFGPQRMNLASIIRGFKSATTKRIHEMGQQDFAWEPRYYDHIIRDDKELHAIQDYIRDNPAKWDEEKNDFAGVVHWME